MDNQIAEIQFSISSFIHAGSCQNKQYIHILKNMKNC